jgi:hypothetical protein
MIGTVVMLATQGSALAQELRTEDVTSKLTRDPRQAPLVVDDIEKYGLTAERLRHSIRRHPDKYAALGDMPAAIAALEEPTQQAFARFKELIPQAVFPPTYFLVGAYRGIGSGSTEGQLITVEKWSLPIDAKTTMIIHELTHFQQVVAVGYHKYKALFDDEKSLLGLCIREGTAEFVAGRVTGKITQDEAVDFTRQHERRLWEQFVTEMDGRETGDWMWSKPANPEQPRHVAYVLGALIVESYYDNTADKEQAMRDILGVTDYATFLERSGYAARFEK